VGLALFLVAASAWRVWLLGAAISCLALAAFLDRSFLAFAAHRGSTTFAIAAAGMQILHRAAGLAGFACGYLSTNRGADVAESGERGLAGGRPRLEVSE
jgi:hypothetical protein